MIKDRAVNIGCMVSGVRCETRDVVVTRSMPAGVRGSRVHDALLIVVCLAVGALIGWLVLHGLGGPEDMGRLTHGTGWVNVPEWLQ